MPLNYDALMRLDIPPIEQRLEARDIILYALGVGLGADPMDERQLPFVYEKELRMLPTMAIVLCNCGPLGPYGDTGMTHSHVVHGEQGFEITKALPQSGTLVGRTRVSAVVDKGAGKGALVYIETAVREKDSGDLVCTLTATNFCRADGGFNGPTGPVPALHTVPTRAPDQVIDLPTLPQAALIYRLSGDYNPLHAEPAYAKLGGYERPILHGRCTFGVAGHAILAACCDYDPTRLRAMHGRFTSPVYPGETIRTELWREGECVSYRSSVPARGVAVINNGFARVV
jgi:acyl dehydratase